MNDIPAGRNCRGCFINDKDPNHVTLCKLFDVRLEYLMEPPWSDFRCDECLKAYPYGARFIVEPKAKPQKEAANSCEAMGMD